MKSRINVSCFSSLGFRIRRWWFCYNLRWPVRFFWVVVIIIMNLCSVIYLCVLTTLLSLISFWCLTSPICDPWKAFQVQSSCLFVKVSLFMAALFLAVQVIQCSSCVFYAPHIALCISPKLLCVLGMKNLRTAIWVLRHVLVIAPRPTQ